MGRSLFAQPTRERQPHCGVQALHGYEASANLRWDDPGSGEERDGRRRRCRDLHSCRRACTQSQRGRRDSLCPQAVASLAAPDSQSCIGVSPIKVGSAR